MTGLIDRQALVLSHIALARKFAKPYIQAYPYADWRQIAYLGLVEAAARFDPGRDVPFGHFARRRIAGALNDAWQSEQRFRRSQLDPLLYRAASQPTHDAESADVAARLLRPLQPPIRSTVELVVIEDCTWVEAAKRMGCASSLVGRRLKRGLKQIKTLLESGAAS